MDYSKLIGKIVEVFGTRDAFANAMGMSNSNLSGKLNNHVKWTTEEVAMAAKLLNIKAKDIHIYFFVPKV